MLSPSMLASTGWKRSSRNLKASEAHDALAEFMAEAAGKELHMSSDQVSQVIPKRCSARLVPPDASSVRAKLGLKVNGVADYLDVRIGTTICNSLGFKDGNEFIVDLSCVALNIFRIKKQSGGYMLRRASEHDYGVHFPARLARLWLPAWIGWKYCDWMAHEGELLIEMHAPPSARVARLGRFDAPVSSMQ